MARTRGNQGRPEPEEGARPDEIDDGKLPAVPEMMRKALAMGLSGFFLTESAVRKAVGDTLPKEWVDFAAEQSDRTRAEFLERLTYEMGRVLENVDLAAALESLLEGRTLEVRAEIRLAPREDSGESEPAQVRVTRAKVNPRSKGKDRR